MKELTPKQTDALMGIANSIGVNHAFEEIKADQGVDTVRARIKREGEADQILSVDPDFIFLTKEIGFECYWSLRNDGLEDQAKEVLRVAGIEQDPKRERLMEIDREYNIREVSPETVMRNATVQRRRRMNGKR